MSLCFYVNSGVQSSHAEKFMGWLSMTHTQRWHSQHKTIGSGHLYQENFLHKMILSFYEYFSSVARQNPAKNQEAREAEFCEILSPNPQHFAKFRSRSAFLHSASFAPKHCGGVQSVFPHFCFSRSTTLRVVALQRAGNASDYDFENRF